MDGWVVGCKMLFPGERRTKSKNKKARKTRGPRIARLGHREMNGSKVPGPTFYSWGTSFSTVSRNCCCALAWEATPTSPSYHVQCVFCPHKATFVGDMHALWKILSVLRLKTGLFFPGKHERGCWPQPIVFLTRWCKCTHHQDGMFWKEGKEGKGGKGRQKSTFIQVPAFLMDCALMHRNLCCRKLSETDQKCGKDTNTEEWNQVDIAESKGHAWPLFDGAAWFVS